MPPFLLALLGTIAGNLSTDEARAWRLRVRGALARRRPAFDRTVTRPPMQVAPPREAITPAVGYGPPVGRSSDYPLDAAALARRLTARR